MKRLPNNTYLIGVDHGYGNMKGANVCFPTGIIAYDSEPLFTRNLLVFENKYYLIGEGHKEFLPNKALDEDYYILTLATIAEELRRESITDAAVFIAAGLPLTWTTGGKKEFEGYLTRKPEVSFSYRDSGATVRSVKSRERSWKNSVTESRSAQPPGDRFWAMKVASSSAAICI